MIGFQNKNYRMIANQNLHPAIYIKSFQKKYFFQPYFASNMIGLLLPVLYEMRP